MSNSNQYGTRAPRFGRRVRGKYDPIEEKRRSPLRKITRPTKDGKIEIDRSLGSEDQLLRDRRKWIEEKQTAIKHDRAQSRDYSPDDYRRAIDSETDSAELNRAIELVEQKKRQIVDIELRAFFREKRENKKYVGRLFQKPINFQTTDGKKVRVLSYGLENIYAQQETEPRAMVAVFVNGKRIFFYRSSGKNSGHPGRWFPTPGPFFVERKMDTGTVFYLERSNRNLKVDRVGQLEKLHGHPQGGKPYFPGWVEEISQKIVRLVETKKIKLHPVQSPLDVRRFHTTVDFFPHLEKREYNKLASLE